MSTETIDALYATLRKRERPEDVAAFLLANFADRFTGDELILLRSRLPRFRSWMNDTFRTAVFPIQRALVNRLFGTNAPENDIDALAAAVATAWPSIGGKQKLAKNARKALGLSRRQYLRRLRALRKTERRIDSFTRDRALCRAMQVAKSGFACDVTRADFVANEDAAFFMAYYTARRNRRSVFTNQGQDRAFDDLAALLYRRASRDGTPRAVGMVFPDAIVMLNDVDKLALLGAFAKELFRLAVLLREVAPADLNRQTMIVKRGNDSSRWNAYAGAWNICRQQWVAALCACGLEQALDQFCPGKVMRLMAADVAAWHRSSGSDVDPDTQVFGALPAPWDVMLGTQECGAQLVRDVCVSRKVDPDARGWTSRPKLRTIVPFVPTMDLVHGVAVADPFAAHVLRKAGVFSGRAAREVPFSFEVERDPVGFALGVKVCSVQTPR